MLNYSKEISKIIFKTETNYHQTGLDFELKLELSGKVNILQVID